PDHQFLAAFPFFDNQGLPPRQFALFLIRSLRVFCRSQLYREEKTAPFTRRAFHLNFSAHHAHEPGGNGQSKPRPPKLPCDGSIGLLESIEILDWCSAGIPTPVSRTSNLISASSPLHLRHSMPSNTSPASVNFTAFPSRLIRICRSLTGSPWTHSGRSPRTDHSKSKP